MKKILIMGLPGSGKTMLATALKAYIESNSDVKHMPAYRASEHVPTSYKCSVDWFNADDIRKRFNDWDFSKEGRIRQSLRMAEFALSFRTSRNHHQARRGHVKAVHCECFRPL